MCPWADFPHIVVYSIWHMEQLQEEMIANFQLQINMSYDEFMAWCTEEHKDKGEYRKMLEVFLWHCKKHLGDHTS